MKYIEQLIAKYLTKNLSEEETEYLRRWVEELPGREEYLRRLAERNDFSVKYRRYEAVDAEGAKRRFLRKIRRRQIFDTTHWAWYSAAAVAALIVVSVWFSRTSESEAPAFLIWALFLIHVFNCVVFTHISYRNHCDDTIQRFILAQFEKPV